VAGFVHLEFNVRYEAAVVGLCVIYEAAVAGLCVR
jgi:hypothetical protein